MRLTINVNAVITNASLRGADLTGVVPISAGSYLSTVMLCTGNVTIVIYKWMHVKRWLMMIAFDHAIQKQKCLCAHDTWVDVHDLGWHLDRAGEGQADVAERGRGGIVVHHHISLQSM